jgi:hypothetical protein
MCIEVAFPEPLPTISFIYYGKVMFSVRVLDLCNNILEG